MATLNTKPDYNRSHNTTKDSWFQRDVVSKVSQAEARGSSRGLVFTSVLQTIHVKMKLKDKFLERAFGITVETIHGKFTSHIRVPRFKPWLRSHFSFLLMFTMEGSR